MWVRERVVTNPAPFRGTYWIHNLYQRSNIVQLGKHDLGDLLPEVPWVEVELFLKEDGRCMRALVPYPHSESHESRMTRRAAAPAVTA
jgi:hypothetical protein